MAKKELVRTLGLTEIMMLGIGGTMGAGVFVLTGHAAGMVGPAMILVSFLATLQSLPNALSYAELASVFPVANPVTAESLMKIAVILGQAREEVPLAAISMVKVPGATFFGGRSGYPGACRRRPARTLGLPNEGYPSTFLARDRQPLT